MTVKYVSFYLIAMLALHVKCHSLQERDVPENVLIVDHHVKNESLSKGYNVQMSLCLTLTRDAMSHNGHAVTMW